MTARRSYTLALLLAAVLASTPCSAQTTVPADEAAIHLAGNDQGIWLVRPGLADKASNPAGLEVYYRQLGKAQWKRIARNIAGEPSRAVAVGQELFLLFEGGKCVRINQAGDSSLCHSLPGKLLAACELKKVGRFQGPSLLAMVEVDAPAPQTSTAPAGTSQPTTQQARPSIGLYLYAGEWAALPGATADLAGRDVRGLATTAGGIWQLTGPANLLRLVPEVAPDQSSAGPGQALADQLTEINATPVSLIGLDDALVVDSYRRTTLSESQPTMQSARTRLSLSVYKPASDSLETYAVRRDNAEATWPADATVHVTPLGEQLALAWTENGTLHFALCSRTGAMGPAEDLTEALATLPDTETAQLVIEYFLLSVVALTIITIFALKPRVGPKPFSLPEHMKTAALIKRIAAALIDYLPFLMAVSALVMPRMSMAEAGSLMDDPQNLPPDLAIRTLYSWLISVGLFSFYAFLMEYRYGATLGKMLLKLRAIGDDGLKLGLREALLRNLLKIIELSMFSSGQMMWFFGIIFLVPIVTKYHQRLGDVIARTTVIDARSETAPPNDSPQELGPIEPADKTPASPDQDDADPSEKD